VTPDEFQQFLSQLTPREHQALTKRLGPLTPQSLEKLEESFLETRERVLAIERRFRNKGPDDDGPKAA
jgi:DNA-directed RNA polymerase sigma subunit (sigma70/sigma32)